MPGSWSERDDPENRACEISLARLSPRLLRRREFMRHLFGVGSLDKHIQNEKEFILASAGVGGEGVWVWVCIRVESINLTWNNIFKKKKKCTGEGKEN